MHTAWQDCRSDTVEEDICTSPAPVSQMRKNPISTHEAGKDSPINGVYEIPMKGYDSEEEAYAAFTSLPFYEESESDDFWNGSVISQSIEIKTDKE